MTCRCHFTVYSITEKNEVVCSCLMFRISQHLFVGSTFFYNNGFVYLSTISYYSTPKNCYNHANVQHLETKGILLRETVTPLVP
jgi:hypothetical protein